MPTRFPLPLKKPGRPWPAAETPERCLRHAEDPKVAHNLSHGARVEPRPHVRSVALEPAATGILVAADQSLGSAEHPACSIRPAECPSHSRDRKPASKKTPVAIPDLAEVVARRREAPPTREGVAPAGRRRRPRDERRVELPLPGAQRPASDQYALARSRRSRTMRARRRRRGVRRDRISASVWDL